jgi:hypothetical protein
MLRSGRAWRARASSSVILGGKSFSNPQSVVRDQYDARQQRALLIAVVVTGVVRRS